MELDGGLMIFGDSIMKGVILSDNSRYKTSDVFNAEALSSELGVPVDNRSRFGCTLEKGLGVLEKTLNMGQSCSAIVLEYGGNDCDFNWEEVAAAPEGEHEPHTPIDKFVALYERAVTLLREKGITPILTTLPPLCSERYLKWICRAGLSKDNILRWLGDVNAIYRYQERYSRAVEALAARLKTPLVDIRSRFLSERKMEDYFCADGIHPNEKGQGLIREAFRSFMEKSGAIAAV
jgi:lysophospholipase L1-like esterase